MMNMNDGHVRVFKGCGCGIFEGCTFPEEAEKGPDKTDL
jgi:hypothetical protein